jgi:tRNA-uridine 2-sulfurtransferase
LCNKEIKFGLFLDWSMREGFDYVATGHYARISRQILQRLEESGAKADIKLLKGVDESKDQSYFLYRLTQAQLSKSLFPIGEMKKGEVRKIAQEQKLIVAEKAESMGICFVGEIDINKFLKRKIDPKQGKGILKSTGEVVGTHEGVWFYTIGQRHGFEITKYVGLPLYVVSKDVERNQLVVGFYNDCLRNEFKTSDTYFISGNSEKSFNCDVRIRHLGQLYKAWVEMLNESTASVKIEQPAFGVAPGQSAVFYQDDEVLGGGIIS